MTNARMDGLSMNIEKESRQRLQSVFPECFVEGELDIDKLLTMCGEYITNDFEKYKFEWHGKGDAMKQAQRRSAACLRPCAEESVNFDTTQNLYIEGDNLEVLKLLQSAYFRQVKMIYIDPPYNTGNDFVYEDDFKDPLAKYLEVTSQATKSNPETMGRFHTAWLNMMYPRLRLAANLLRDDGVIFISIDDNEVHNLRKLCDEVFGEENFVAQFVWKRRSGANDAKNNVSLDHEYVICYAKFPSSGLNGVIKEFEKYTNPDNDPRGEWARDNLTCGKTASQRPNLFYPITDPTTGIEYPCNPDHVWRFEKTKMNEFIKTSKVIFHENGKGLPSYKRHRAEVRSDTKPFSSLLDTRLNLVATKELRDIFEAQLFDYPKTVDLIAQLIYQGTDTTNTDIILDFFSGSATTAHAVMQLNKEDGGNRRFICVQLPELCDEKSEAYKAGYKNICEIGKERIRRAGARLSEELGVSGEELGVSGEELGVSGEELGVRSEELGVRSVELGVRSEKLGVRSEKLGVRSVELGVRSEKLEVSSEKLKLETTHSSLLTTNLDRGFKVFKLDASNIKFWDGIPVGVGNGQLYFEKIRNVIDGIKDDRPPLDVVYELMLKLGVPLTCEIEEKEILGKTVYSVDGDLLLFCLDKDITAEFIEALADLAPAKIIVAEMGFADDTAMANAHYILRDKGIEIKLV